MTDRYDSRGKRIDDRTGYLRFRNVSGEEIPEFACIKLQAHDAAGNYFEAAKPDGSGSLHFFNGPTPVPVNQYGEALTWGSVSIVGRTTGLFGESVGPVADSWDMETGGSGFVVFSEPDTGIAAILKDSAKIKIELGQVRRCLGKGWYEVDLAGEWSGEPREIHDWASDPNINGLELICGSYPSRGSGSGSGSGAGGCDECQDVETLNCLNRTGDASGYFVPVDTPGPPVVERIGYAHTLHPILYATGSWLKIVHRPDVLDEGVINRSGSGSGSGSGPSGLDYIGKRYDIIDGQVPLRELVIPEYRLCRNETTGECTVILARTNTIYFPHMSCGVVDLDQCREVTTSGTPSGAE